MRPYLLRIGHHDSHHPFIMECVQFAVQQKIDRVVHVVRGSKILV